MPLDKDVAQIFRDYPRIYFACHRTHVRDPNTGTIVSAHQVGILDHLDTVSATPLGDLAQHMGVTPATMSVAITRLVDAGYVARVIDRADRRRIELRLTDAGARVCAANSVLEPSLVRNMLNELSAPDRRRALAGMALLGRAAMASQQTRVRATKRKRTNRKTRSAA